MTPRTVTLAGALPVPAEPVVAAADVDDPTAALIAAVAQVRDDPQRGDMAEVMRLFRETDLWVQRQDDGARHVVPAVQAEGLSWLPVHTSLEWLALFAQATGRGDQEIQYGRLTGAEIVDEVLPGLPTGTGMLLDPLSPHVFALPAVRGIVPPERAVNTGEADRG